MNAALMVDIDGVLIDSFPYEVRMLAGKMSTAEYEEQSAAAAQLICPVCEWVQANASRYAALYYVTARKDSRHVQKVLDRGHLPHGVIYTRGSNCSPAEHKYATAKMLRGTYENVLCLEDSPDICFVLSLLRGVSVIRVPGYPLEEPLPTTGSFLPTIRSH